MSAVEYRRDDPRSRRRTDIAEKSVHETRTRRVAFDIEADSLNPSVIWVVVCKDLDTGEVDVFRRPDLDSVALLDYWSDVGLCVGHNVFNYDLPVIRRLVGGFQYSGSVLDTLVLSRLLDYGRDGGHSLASWGLRLGFPKTDFHDYSALTDEMVSYCIQDVEIVYQMVKKLSPWLESDTWKKPIETEMFMAGFCYEMHENGFHFDVDKCVNLRYNILKELEKLDAHIAEAFPPKVGLVREIQPRTTKFGTLNRNDFRWAGPDLSDFNGGPFSLIEYVDFNPGSPAQIVERLNEAGWQPTEKTKGHNQVIRDKDQEKIARFQKTGWTISEVNLATLPDTAPPAAKSLALRITLASRARTLTEWIDNYNPQTGCIHGHYNSLGAWTHRMSHVRPNTGNIPTPQPLNKDSTNVQRRAHDIDRILRTFWICPEGSFLVGCDAEGIQLRVLAHYINDPRFTKAVTEGDKDAGTDPHSLNAIALGSACKSRAEAKTFIYAWLLGAGVGKVAQILTCSYSEAKVACENFIKFYPGLHHLKTSVIPGDASRGYFQGFDGRYVRIAGDDQGSKEHYALAGWLQNGETVIMRRATELWYPRLKSEGIPFKQCNLVHDEFQTAVYGTKEVADYVGQVQAWSIKQAGEDLNLRCPMAGAYDIGLSWSETH